MGLLRGIRGGVDDLIELAVPSTCGGCGARRVRWCAACDAHLHDVPALISTTVNVGTPVWTLGRYDGARRNAVLQCKDRGRSDLAGPLGVALAHAILRLRAWGDVPSEVALVPAPTTAWAARRRGGDVVTSMCRSAARTSAPVCPVVVAPILRSSGVRDSVGLGAAERAANVRGAIRVRGALAAQVRAPVVLIDDVVTTGATLAESVTVLRRSGLAVCAALTVAAA